MIAQSGHHFPSGKFTEPSLFPLHFSRPMSGKFEGLLFCHEHHLVDKYNLRNEPFILDDPSHRITVIQEDLRA
jgi:hypothetical protein